MMRQTFLKKFQNILCLNVRIQGQNSLQLMALQLHKDKNYLVSTLVTQLVLPL